MSQGNGGLSPIIRPAAEADLPGIFAIYDHEVLHGTATFDTEPKSAAGRLDWLRDDAGGRYPILVADSGGEIAGWARLHAWSNRCAYARAAENAVYVDRARRGQGVGHALLAELIRLAPARGVCVLLARIVDGNPASLALHEAHGFQTIGLMRRVGEKFGRVLDVRLMDRHLEPAGAA
jgi:phosphinothricin acetyltransferase